MDFAKRVRELPNVAEAIAQSLEELIVNGELKGGTFLRQEDLATQYGVSRIPIRDALHILRQKGLVETVPRRGMRVTPITAKMIEDLYGLREALETHTVRIACTKLTDADLDALREIVDVQRSAVERGDVDAFIRADMDFHMKICEIAGNDAISEATSSTWNRINQLRSAARLDSKWGIEWSTRAIPHHEEIIDALATRDPDHADAVLRAMLALGTDQLARKLESMQLLSPTEE